MKLNQELVDAAIKLIIDRYGDKDDWKGAAAMYTESGKILTSTTPLMPNGCVDLCHETGAICEAHKINEKVTASVCVSREKDKYHILSPCGVCQERLYLWGPDVEVAVPAEKDSTIWQSKTLADVHPYYWKNAFA
jgi:cytidine deaminase